MALNWNVRHNLKAILLLAFWLGSTTYAAASQDGSQPPASGKSAEPTAPASTSDDGPIFEEGEAVVREFSRADVKKFCQRYAGRLISYYGDVYEVKNCRRHLITDHKTTYGHLRNGHSIVEVGADVIAAIPEGAAVDRDGKPKTIRSCRTLEGRYVTFSNVDIYYMERCHKRRFPDWETYTKHRGSRKGEILSLSWEEFSAIEEGAEIPSILDKIFAGLISGDAGVDVIPVDEACRGLEGRLASYYSRLYRIEKCRKRQIVSPETYFKGGAKQGEVREMRSEQWLSLPDGAPIGREQDKQKNKPSSLRQRS